MTDTTHQRVATRQANYVKVAMLVFHIACLGVIVVGVSPVAALVALGMYLVRAFGITAGFHRMLAHRSFKASRPVQFALTLFGSLAVQGGPIWWVSHHRTHHRYTETDKDIHSPRTQGFWNAHIGWMMQAESFMENGANSRDLHKYPEIKFLQRHYAAIIVAQMLAMFTLGWVLNVLNPGLGTSGLQMLVWGFFISTVALWHATFMVNSVCHRWGQQPYDANDDSTNNWLVGLLAIGEGWHNNHHKFPYSARHGLKWWQFDLTWIVLRSMATLRLISDLRLPRKIGTASADAAA
ncbi:MAG: fatty acid desaturase [Pseudomonadota bacterium]